MRADLRLAIPAAFAWAITAVVVGLDAAIPAVEGGVIGNALMPGSAPILGCSSRAISRVLRSRSSQGVARRNTEPWATVGLPMLAKMRSNSG